jgi:hypothetical protein
MTWDVLRTDVLPRPPPRARALAIAAGIGVLTGLISSLPSPLPDLALDDPDILVSAERIPLHAGVAFGGGVALIVWLWANRDLGKCLLALVLTLIGWIAAVNTANDVLILSVSSELFGTEAGAKEGREMLGLLLGGVAAGAVGAGLTAFGAGIAAESVRRTEAWAPVVGAGALFGILLYPAVANETIALLLVPWQAAVAAALANALIRVPSEVETPRSI